LGGGGGGGEGGEEGVVYEGEMLQGVQYEKLCNISVLCIIII